MPDSPPAASTKNPYIGPRPFERTEQVIFFGREWETEELVALIVAHPAVLFYAQSGAGKSSLLNARVLHALEDAEGCELLPVARVRGDLPPGVQPGHIKNIYIFNTLLSWSDQVETSPAELVDCSLAEFLQRFPHQSDADGYPALRILFFDQFEEIFTFYPERWPEREQFFRQVDQALQEDSLLRVLFVIREDYLAQLDPYVELLPEQLRSRFRLERLRKESALAAVTGPLRHTRRSFAPGTAEALVDELIQIRVEDRSGQMIEVPGEFVEPVQLQVVCQNLWEELPAEVTEITQGHLHSFGDIDQALTSFYERVIYQTVRQTPVRESRLRNWFEREIITPAGTRGIVYRAAHTTGGVQNAAVDILEAHHIIRGEQRAGARWYELTHDRFITPIQTSNTAWRSARLKKWGLIGGSALAIIALVGFISFIMLGLSALTAQSNRAKTEQAATAIVLSGATGQAAKITRAPTTTAEAATRIAATEAVQRTRDAELIAGALSAQDATARAATLEATPSEATSAATADAVEIAATRAAQATSDARLVASFLATSAAATSEATSFDAPTDAPAPGRPPISGKLAFPIDNGSGQYDINIVSMPDGALLGTIPGARQPNFRPDGSRLIANGQGGGFGEDVWEFEPSGNPIRPVSSSPSDSHPIYNPSGDRIAYGNPQLAIGSDGNYHSYIFVQCGTVPPNLESGKCQDIAQFGVLVPAGQVGEIQGSNPVWASNDHIYYRGCNSWAGGGSCGVFTVGSWGTKYSSDGETPRKIGDGTSLTPTDTKGGFFAFHSRETGNWEAYVASLDGSAVVNVSNNPGSSDGLPTISPDGQWIAFASDREGGWAVYVAPISGGPATKLLDFPQANPWGTGDRDWTNERMSWGP